MPYTLENYLDDMISEMECEKCEVNPAQLPHTCPLNDEGIHDDPDFRCTCCVECTRKCREDV